VDLFWRAILQLPEIGCNISGVGFWARRNSATAACMSAPRGRRDLARCSP